ncbi:MAG: RNA polymerase sigma factor [Clostridia bacterium]|jgi:RNA polymerase sigma factor (sigma-70 family)|nr:sigma-70 family RNA polymerase sigma factor [Clostridiaceae bacterium]
MDDDSIVRMYWERNEKAISVTSEKYGSYCLSIAKNILDNQEDAEECVNDTYLHAWNSIPPNRPKILSTYLGKIVRNLSFNVYKRNKAEKRGSGQIALVLDEPSAIVADSKNQEDEWNRKLLVSAINAFLSELPTEKRKIIVCRYWYAAGM